MNPNLNNAQRLRLVAGKENDRGSAEFGKVYGDLANQLDGAMNFMGEIMNYEQENS